MPQDLKHTAKTEPMHVYFLSFHVVLSYTIIHGSYMTQGSQ